MSHHPLARLGWRAELDHHLGDPGLVPARVTAVDRGSVVVDDGTRAWRATLAGRVAAQPATGDFVAAVPDGPVREILPRRGVIARRADGRRVQVLAANVDLALLATSANRDLNARRIARFLAITTRGDVDALVLMTKSDLSDDPQALATHLAAELDGTPVTAVSALDGSGMSTVRAALGPGRTAVLLGSSGVGKSTLLNALVGHDQQPTAPIRAGDDRGRHTTTRRELIALPDGALLIDTPGLRLVAPLEDGDDVPPVDRDALRRQRRARERAFHREIYRDMRSRMRERERQERRHG